MLKRLEKMVEQVGTCSLRDGGQLQEDGRALACRAGRQHLGS